MNRRKLTFRLLYSSQSNTTKFTDFDAFRSKWNSLEVQVVGSIPQRICIPEMQLEYKRNRFFLLRRVTKNKTVIYLAKTAQTNEFLSLYLGLALERYFEMPELGTKIDKILSLPSHMVPDLLAVHWGIRELPPDWLRRLEAELEHGQDDLSQQAEEVGTLSESDSDYLTASSGSSRDPSRGTISPEFQTPRTVRVNNRPSIPRPNFGHESESEQDDQNIISSRPTSEIIHELIGALNDKFDGMSDEQRNQRRTRRIGPRCKFSGSVREGAISTPNHHDGPAVSTHSQAFQDGVRLQQSNTRRTSAPLPHHALPIQSKINQTDQINSERGKKNVISGAIGEFFVR
jgi:hypothetical protein